MQSGKTIFALQCCPWQLFMVTEWGIAYSVEHVVLLTSEEVGISADPMGL